MYTSRNSLAFDPSPASLSSITQRNSVTWLILPLVLSWIHDFAASCSSGNVTALLRCRALYFLALNPHPIACRLLILPRNDLRQYAYVFILMPWDFIIYIEVVTVLSYIEQRSTYNFIFWCLLQLSSAHYSRLFSQLHHFCLHTFPNFSFL